MIRPEAFLAKNENSMKMTTNEMVDNFAFFY
jgi:hypothetical protein